MNDSECLPIHKIDSCYENHAVYVIVINVKILSHQFVKIEFEPVSKNINGEAFNCEFIVYDDNEVTLPNKHQNYIANSTFIKSIYPSTPAIEAMRNKIDDHYKNFKKKRKELRDSIKKLDDKIRANNMNGIKKRHELDEEFSTILDGIVYNNLEEIAYTQEVNKYIES